MRFLSVIALFFFLTNSRSINLLNSPIEDPWFIEHIAFEPIDLPSGVKILFVTDESARPFEFIVFKNISSVPLIIVGTPQGNYTEFDTVPFEFPLGTGPLYKVVDGQAYIWQMKSNNQETGYHYAWYKESERDDSIWLYVSDNQIRCQNATISYLEIRNHHGGDRPKDVTVPDPQYLVLPLIYGSEQIEIQITISYTLNYEYQSFANLQREQSLFISVICFVFIMAIFFMIRGLTVNNSRSNSA